MKTNKSLFFAVATIALAGLGLLATPASSQSGNEPHHLRVIWTTDPAHAAKISWTTTGEGSTHRVFYDTQERGGDPSDYAFEVEVNATGEYSSGGSHFHHAQLADLEPATKYFFVVESDGRLSSELNFVTAHADDRPFKLLYGGDSRTGRDERQMMNQRIRSLHEDDPSILAMVHGGDYIEHANSWRQWDEWMEDHQLTIGSDGRVLPIVPAKGNHEGRGALYNDVFANPGGASDKTWFRTEIGDLTLLNLDTEVSMAGTQRDWLRDNLESGRDSKWLVVNYHRPAYPAVKSPSGAKEHWVPLFEEFDVDLVCESDGHTLKRTPPIRKDRVDYTGVVYVGEGGLGVAQRTPDFDRWYLQAPGMATRAHHVQLLSFEDGFIRYGAIVQAGEVLDEITVMPRAARLENKIAPVFGEVKSTTRVEIGFNRSYDVETAQDLSNWAFDPPLEVNRIVAAPVVDAVLELVNGASLEELDDDVGLDRRAATNILAARPITSWEELDAVSYVGVAALKDLADYTSATVENPRNVVTLEVEELDPETVYRAYVSDVQDVEQDQTVMDGATVSFVFGGADGRADAINAAGDAPGGSDGLGCSSTTGSPQLAGLLLFLAGFFTLRRRRA